jgi:hypothetical protein
MIRLAQSSRLSLRPVDAAITGETMANAMFSNITVHQQAD